MSGQRLIAPCFQGLRYLRDICKEQQPINLQIVADLALCFRPCALLEMGIFLETAVAVRQRVFSLALERNLQGFDVPSDVREGRFRKLFYFVGFFLQ